MLGAEQGARARERELPDWAGKEMKRQTDVRKKKRRARYNDLSSSYKVASKPNRRGRVWFVS